MAISKIQKKCTRCLWTMNLASMFGYSSQYVWKWAKWKPRMSILKLSWWIWVWLSWAKAQVESGDLCYIRWFIELVSSSSLGHGLSQHLLFGRIQLYVVLDFLYTCQKSQINLVRIYLMSHLMASQQRCDRK